MDREESSTVHEVVQDAYLNLLIRTVANIIYGPQEPGFNEEARTSGMQTPTWAHSGLGMRRLGVLANIARSSINQGIPGDFVDCGTWRGGSAILLRGVLSLGEKGRRVHVADTFSGHPEPTHDADKHDIHHTLKEFRVPLEEVKDNFRRYGFTTRVDFLKGNFKDTLPTLDRPLALIHIDCNHYQGTLDALEALYPILSSGGYVISDDYHFPNVNRAIDEFRDQNVPKDGFCDLNTYDNIYCWWRKTTASVS